MDMLYSSSLRLIAITYTVQSILLNTNTTYYLMKRESINI